MNRYCIFSFTFHDIVTDPAFDIADGPGHVLEVYDPGRYEGRSDNDDDAIEPDRPNDDILARVRHHTFPIL